MSSYHPIRKVVTAAAAVIPDKLYFRIGDVAKLCGVPAYVLRFWETEFPQLKPNKGGTGQRLYRRRDVEIALRIKHLLYEQGYTIAGARQAFAADAKAGDAKASDGKGNDAAEAASQPRAQAMAGADRAGDEVGSEVRPGSGADGKELSWAGRDGRDLMDRGESGLRGHEEEQRWAEMLALRDELRELANQLAQPVGRAKTTPGDADGGDMAEVGAVAAKPRTIRPRLVLEPKAEGRAGSRQTEQGDLFSYE
ncbi:MAG: MerR family transcriptional regulator [Acidobacteriaceae bacterium]